VDRVWGALVEMFGQTILTNFGASPPPVWRRKIDELTDWQIQRGLDRMAEMDAGFAPTLGQFINACKAAPERRTPPVTGPTRDQCDHWEGQLNLLLLSKVQRACGLPSAILAECVSYKRSVAQQFRAAFSDTPAPDDEFAEIVQGVSKYLDEIIAKRAAA
jgi:hypothetical protein